MGKSGSFSDLITYIDDRPGQDRRYASDASKIKEELDWYPSVTFEEGLEATIDWYLSNLAWCFQTWQKSGYDGERIGKIMRRQS